MVDKEKTRRKKKKVTLERFKNMLYVRHKKRGPEEGADTFGLWDIDDCVKQVERREGHDAPIFFFSFRSSPCLPGLMVETSRHRRIVFCAPHNPCRW